MSRFNNLEFGEEFESQLHSHQQSGSGQRLVKDENYYLAEAQTAFENGQFEEALRLYAKVLEFNPRNAAAWTGQVRMLIELNELRKAKNGRTRPWNGFRTNRNCWRPRPWHSPGWAISKRQLPTRTRRSASAVRRLMSGSHAAMCKWRAKKNALVTVSRKRSRSRRRAGSSAGWLRGFITTTRNSRSR